MNKNEAITPFLVASLSILFATICLMVFFTKGKSAKWVSRKMLIGGLLLSLATTVETGCRRSSCYMTSRASKRFRYKNEKKEEIQLSVVNSKFIQGKIKHRYFSSYIYLIIDTSLNQKIIKGKLIALDGSFDKPAEKFEIKFKPELKKGNYQLKIYPNNSDFIELKNEIHKSIIHIKDE